MHQDNPTGMKMVQHRTLLEPSVGEDTSFARGLRSYVFQALEAAICEHDNLATPFSSTLPNEKELSSHENEPHTSAHDRTDRHARTSFFTTKGDTQDDYRAQLDERIGVSVNTRLPRSKDSAGRKSGANGDRAPLNDSPSKYRNIESLLRYVESDNTQGGIKLVIMNFND